MPIVKGSARTDVKPTDSSILVNSAGGVKGAGEQHPRAAGDRAPYDGFVLIAILEVEMYQQRRRSGL